MSAREDTSPGKPRSDEHIAFEHNLNYVTECCDDFISCLVSAKKAQDPITQEPIRQNYANMKRDLSESCWRSLTTFPTIGAGLVFKAIDRRMAALSDQDLESLLQPPPYLDAGDNYLEEGTGKISVWTKLVSRAKNEWDIRSHKYKSFNTLTQPANSCNPYAALGALMRLQYVWEYADDMKRLPTHLRNELDAQLRIAADKLSEMENAEGQPLKVMVAKYGEFSVPKLKKTITDMTSLLKEVRDLDTKFDESRMYEMSQRDLPPPRQLAPVGLGSIRQNKEHLAIRPPRAGSPVDPGPYFSAGSVRPVHEDIAILEDREPYKSAVMPLVPYSQKFLQKLPPCRGHNRSGVFVEGPDGKVRRFPHDIETPAFRVLGGREGMFPESIGRALARDITYISDAHRDEIHETLAEYTINRSVATAEFRIGGKSVKSIQSTAAVYPLPGGKWMIPQGELRAFSYACEQMLLAEGKPEHLVAEQMSHSSTDKDKDSRKSLDLVCQSLAARTGQAPTVVLGEGLTSTASIEKLKAAIEEHGPCMFHSDGRFRILDRIEEGVEGHLFTVRDPYHASFLKIKDHEAFWHNPMTMSGPTETPWQEAPRNWDAIFLPKTGLPNEIASML